MQGILVIIGLVGICLEAEAGMNVGRRHLWNRGREPMPTMAVWESAGYVFARMQFSATHDYQISFQKQNAQNGTVHGAGGGGNILVPVGTAVGSVSGAVSIGSWVDEFAPVYINGRSVNAGAHNQALSKITLAGHGLAETTHKGARWRDNNNAGRRFALYAVLGNDLYFIAEASGGSIQAAPSGDMVSLDGYATLSGYSGAGFTSGAIIPSVYQVSQSFLADDVEIPANGVVEARELKITSEFEMPNMSLGYATLTGAADKAGWNVSMLPRDLRVARVITIYPWRQLTGKQTLTTLAAGYDYSYLSPVIQRNPMTYIAPYSHNWAWLPGVKTKSGFTLGTLGYVAAWTGGVDYTKAAADCDDITALPEVMFAWRADSTSTLAGNNFVAGSAHGFVPTLGNGGLRSSRVNNNSRCWSISGAGKSYPYYNSGYAPWLGEADVMAGFYAVWPPQTEALLSKFWLKVENHWLVYLAWNDTGAMAASLPSYLARWNAAVLRAVNGTLDSPETGSGRLEITKAAAPGYLVVKLWR